MKTLLFFCLFIIFLVSAFFFVNNYRRDRPESVDYSRSYEDKVLFAEAVSLINKNALFLSPEEAKEKIDNVSLKEFLSSRDPYSDYLTRNEYRRFQELQDDGYVGIGMDIKKERSGRILCFPYPGSSAENAGIKAGDRLIRINGMTVDGKSLPSVAALAGGEAGTRLQLIVATKNELEKQFTVVRAKLSVENVVTRRLDGLSVVKVRDFSRDTKEKLQQALDKLRGNTSIIIDLRGNSGGDLFAAIDSAMLFLEKGERIVSIETRQGVKDISSVAGTLDIAIPIYLWQDGGTASAAEIFIAALTENKKAVSVGQRTFGKGTKQDIITLSDGSALVLTTGKMMTPTGLDFHGFGLDPTHRIPQKAPTTKDFLFIMKKLLN